MIGTTSAYAENTTAWRTTVDCSRNYLRVRGEYILIRPSRIQLAELPPRTRRILAGPVKDFAGNGTTSAYAENTRAQTLSCCLGGNYLRVRGEYGYPQTLRS